MGKSRQGDDWAEWWDARVAAIETVLGPCDDIVGHAGIPFDIGADNGGGADIIFFKKHVNGVVSVTSELIGRDDQIENDLGNYELVICHRDAEDWGPDLISRLAYYTLRARINPGETMDIAAAAPEGSTTAALLFFNYGTFNVRKRRAGLLLCVGITADELKLCRAGNRDRVEKALKAAKVYPFTDLYRDSAISK
jgi:hypothetical protein